MIAMDHLEQCQFSHCHDCGACAGTVEMLLVCADYGQGAFLHILCKVCDHRRWYRAELQRRKAQRAQAVTLDDWGDFEDLPYGA